MANFILAVGPALVHEGGFANNPKDPGGATNFGISLRWLKTQKDLDGHLIGDLDGDGDVDIDDIRKMTIGDAVNLYHDRWWKPYPYDRMLSQRVATKVFDTAINMGTIRAFQILQRAVNAYDPAFKGTLIVDGKFGPNTLNAVNDCDDEGILLGDYCQFQKGVYLHLIDVNPKLIEFRGGWMRRAAWC